MTTEELKELGLDVVRRGESRMVYLPEESMAIEAWPSHSEHWENGDDFYSMEFVIYECVRWTRGESKNGYMFSRKNRVGGPDFVDELDEAEWRIWGGLKWDGCVNYYYNQEGCMLHGCGVHDRKRELAVWEALYKLGGETMTAHWDGA